MCLNLLYSDYCEVRAINSASHGLTVKCIPCKVMWTPCFLSFSFLFHLIRWLACEPCHLLYSFPSGTFPPRLSLFRLLVLPLRRLLLQLSHLLHSSLLFGHVLFLSLAEPCLWPYSPPTQSYLWPSSPPTWPCSSSSFFFSARLMAQTSPRSERA